MGQPMDDNNRLIRNLLAIAAIVGIAELTELDLILSGVTRPMLVALAQVFAIEAVDQGTAAKRAAALSPSSVMCSCRNNRELSQSCHYSPVSPRCVSRGRVCRASLSDWLSLADSVSRAVA